MPSPRRRRRKGATPLPLSPHVTATSTAPSPPAIAPSNRSAASSPAPVNPAVLPIPPLPSLDARMDLPPLCFPCSSSNRPRPTPLPPPGPPRPLLCPPVPNSRRTAKTRLPPLLSMLSFDSRSWLASLSGASSIVTRVGAVTAAALLTDVDATLPAIVDDPSISLQELNVTGASLDERLIEMAASYRAPSHSLSLLQARLDRTAARLVDPSTTVRPSTATARIPSHPPPARSRRRSSTNRRRRRRRSSSSSTESSSESSFSDSEENRSPSPSSGRPSGGAASTGVPRVVPHGRRA
ncbi:MAG: hypothetical protein BJ554DRAFT_5070, partial [Olpidium bornovanus]